MSSLIEAAVNDKDNDDDEDIDCRLRHTLNPDCLTEIFKYLDQFDLLTLSKMNSHYKEIIVNRIIPFRQLNLVERFDQRGQSKWLMAEFGGTVKSIKFKGDREHFAFLLEFISDYCDVNQLEKLDITTRRDERFLSCDGFDSDLVNRMQKYFENVHFLAIDANGSNWQLPQELFALSDGIRVLQLKNFSLKGKFQNWTHFGELTDLTLIHISEFKSDKFAEFLRAAGALQRFISDDSDFKTGETVAEHCGATVRTFGDLRKCSSRENPLARHNFLDKFEMLNEVILTSEFVCMSDMYRPLRILALKDSIESLEIKQVDTKPFPFEPPPELPKFNQLKTLKLCIREREHEAEQLDEQMHSKFILNNANKLLTNVQTLHLSGAFTKNMSTIIRLTTKLKRLWIHELEARRLLIQARRIVAGIGHIIGERQAHNAASKSNNLVYVTICGEQWRDFAVFERNPIKLFLRGKRKANMRNFEIAGTAKIPKPF